MGLIVLYAASFYNAQDQGNPLSEVLSQLMGVGVGAVGMALVLRVDYRVLQNSAVCLGLVALSLLLLVLVAIPGVGKSVNGSRRWLSLGFVGFQPSELAKYSMVAYMARALAARRRDLQRLFRGLAPLRVDGDACGREMEPSFAHWRMRRGGWRVLRAQRGIPPRAPDVLPRSVEIPFR